MSDMWQPIETAPVGPALILANENTKDVFAGYGYWQGSIPRPLWCSLHPDGIGRCRPTHWQPMPIFDVQEVAREVAA